MLRKRSILLLVAFLFLLPNKLLAKEKLGCDDRYLTLINPVRGRDLWSEKSLSPLEKQYEQIAQYNFSATWLLQYDALTDEELVQFIKNNFSNNQELGLFLEVSPWLAQSSRVVYPSLVAWFEPQAVFLSGYSPKEREREICVHTHAPPTLHKKG